MSGPDDGRNTAETTDAKATAVESLRRRLLRSESALLLILLLPTIGYCVLALSYPFGRGTQPGPAFVPVIAGCSTLVLLVIALALPPGSRSELPAAEDEAPIETPDTNLWRTLLFLLVLAAYLVVLQTIGQLLASAVMVLATLLLCRARPVWQMVVAAVATSGVSFVVFAYLLDVPLPTRIGF